jgi:hypothetical protein
MLNGQIGRLYAAQYGALVLPGIRARHRRRDGDGAGHRNLRRAADLALFRYYYRSVLPIFYFLTLTNKWLTGGDDEPS